MQQQGAIQSHECLRGTAQLNGDAVAQAGVHTSHCKAEGHVEASSHQLDQDQPPLAHTVRPIATKPIEGSTQPTLDQIYQQIMSQKVRLACK